MCAMFTFYCNLDSTYKRIAYYLPNSQYIVTVRTRFLANTSKHPQTIVYILNHLHKLLATASENTYTWMQVIQKIKDNQRQNTEHRRPRQARPAAEEARPAAVGKLFSEQIWIFHESRLLMSFGSAVSTWRFRARLRTNNNTRLNYIRVKTHTHTHTQLPGWTIFMTTT